MQNSGVPEEVRNGFDNQKIALFPLLSKNLSGDQVLHEYVDTHPGIWGKLNSG